MKQTFRIFRILSLGVTASYFACTTAVQSAPSSNRLKSQGNTKLKEESASTAPQPAKVQEELQREFARQLTKAGPKAEGWALFSNSGMAHNGQKWIIHNREKSPVISFCHIKQGEKDCASKSLTEEQFKKIEEKLKAGDKLDHLISKSFDGMIFEYLHARSSNPNTRRAVFNTSATPLPDAYEELIKTFNQ